MLTVQSLVWLVEKESFWQLSFWTDEGFHYKSQLGEINLYMVYLQLSLHRTE